MMLVEVDQRCKPVDMRTTIKLDPDVLAAAEQLRRERHIGLGEAVNELARAGMLAKPEHKPFVQKTHAFQFKVDVSNIAEVMQLQDLEKLEELRRRSEEEST